MRIRGSAVLGLTLVLSALACGPGAGTKGAVEDTIPAYDPDTLAWVKQARPVVFNERGWLRTGETVNKPDVTRVGQFEGMDLYAPADETVPYQHLLIPVGHERWQMLAPMSRAPEPVADTAAASAVPRQPRAHTPPPHHTRH